jgi:hypothetical protein
MSKAGWVLLLVALLANPSSARYHLDELEAASGSEAASFRAALDKQLRTGRAVLNLLGSNSLETVRWELADNLQRSFGPANRPVDRFFGAVADRESRSTGSSENIRDTVNAVIRLLKSVGDHPSKLVTINRLLTEAAAVVRVQGNDPIALEGIRIDLAFQLE